MLFGKLLKYFNKEKYCLKKSRRLLTHINSLENKIISMTREEILLEIEKVKNILSLEINYSTETDVYEINVVKILAIAREVCRRTINQRPFDAQIIAALCLNENEVIEMLTGQGKTLVSLLSAIVKSFYSNVHIVTINDYLAERDYNDMKPVYDYIGITVGCVIHTTDELKRIEEFKKSITYTSTEIIFIFIKDNMQYRSDRVVIGLKNFYKSQYIGDELDSQTLDLGTIPVVIGQADYSNYSRNYSSAFNVINSLSTNDIYVDKKDKDVYIKEESLPMAEALICQYFNVERDDIYAYEDNDIMFTLIRMMQAMFLFEKNKQYIVRDFKIRLIDENTGRVASSRKYSDGLQAAIETKERVKISARNNKLNFINVPTFFRMYTKNNNFSGMTGTAKSDEEEIKRVYGRIVCVIPPEEKQYKGKIIFYRPLFFKDQDQKYNAMALMIKELHKAGQPVLVGTPNINASEIFSMYLKEKDVPHKLLNAKNLTEEHEIIAKAGIFKAVTVATNIAGRGTDIKIGGSINYYYNKLIGNKILTEEEKKIYLEKAQYMFEENRKKAMQSGGLCVFIDGAQQKRIDLQLAGRTGRRNDIGAVRTYIALTDEIFTTDGNKFNNISELITDSSGVNSRLLEHAVSKLQSNLSQKMFRSRIDVLTEGDAIENNRKKLYDVRNKVLHNNINYVETVKAIMQYMKNLNNENPDKFNTMFNKVSFNIPDIIDNNVALDFLNSLMIKHVNYDFIMKYEEEIRTSFLAILDKLWQEFINTKDIVRRLDNFRNKFDPILESKKSMGDLFDKIFSKYEFLLIFVIYRIIYDRNLHVDNYIND